MRITQEHIASRVGMTRSMVSEFFSGRRPLGVKSAARFAEILETTPGQVIDMNPGQLEALVKARLSEDKTQEKVA